MNKHHFFIIVSAFSKWHKVVQKCKQLTQRRVHIFETKNQCRDCNKDTNRLINLYNESLTNN